MSDKVTRSSFGRRNEEVSTSALNALLVEQITKSMQVQEKDLRWKNMRFFILVGGFLLLYAGYFIFGYFTFFSGPDKADGDYASMVRIEGLIDASGKASADKINPALVKAFSDKKAKGVVLLINSPGGSPVQSSLMYDRINELREKYPKLKVVVVAEDMLTSGSYWIASVADKIYVNRSTVTGSVGVIAAQFGYPKIMERFGVERRVVTAGLNKNRMDQYLPAKAEDKAKIESLLKGIHQHFIEAVMKNRKDRLKASPEKLFTGDFWNGDEAVKLGLADSLGGLPTALKNEFGVEFTQDYTPAPGFFDHISGIFSNSIRELFLSESAGIVIR